MLAIARLVGLAPFVPFAFLTLAARFLGGFLITPVSISAIVESSRLAALAIC